LAGRRVLGIDPGSRLCGWGVVYRSGRHFEHVDNGVIVLDAKRPLGERLAALLERLDEVLAEHAPSVVAVETVFHNRNARAALILGHARGVALAAAARRGLPIHEYTPQQVKKAVTGSGRADKAQIQQMVTLLLELPEAPQVDAADAVAVALCHAQHLDAAGASAAVPPRARGAKRRAQAGLQALVEAQQKARR